MVFFKALFKNKKTKIVRRETIDITKIGKLQQYILRRINQIIEYDYICLDNQLFFMNFTRLNKTNMILHLNNDRGNIKIHIYVSRFGYYCTVKNKEERELYHIVFTSVTNALIIRCKFNSNKKQIPDVCQFLFPDWFKFELSGYIFSNTF